MSLIVEKRSKATRQVSHSNVVTSVMFSPDGRDLASGSWDGTVKLWDVREGRPKLKRTYRGDWDEVEAVAFTHDGKALAGLGTGFDSAPFGVVTVWAPDSTRGLTLVHEDSKIDALAFSPDGTTLATGSGDRRIVTLWDIATQKVRAVLSGHPSAIWSVAYSPDGTKLAVACGALPTMSEPSSVVQSAQVWLWDLSAPEPCLIKCFTGHEQGIIAVAFSPDGTQLASGGFGRMAKLWNIETGVEGATLAGHEGWIAALAFSPDGGTLATGSHDHTIKLWDLETGRETSTLTGHIGNVYSVAFSPNGTLLASGSLDGTVRLWDMDHAKHLDADTEADLRDA